MTDDPMPASFVWSEEEDQQEPTGPALGTYPMREALKWERRNTVGAKLARFLEDLADRVRGWH